MAVRVRVVGIGADLFQGSRARRTAGRARAPRDLVGRIPRHRHRRPEELDNVRAVLRNRRTMLVLAGSTADVSSNWLLFIYSVTVNQVLQSSLGYFMSPLLFVALAGRHPARAASADAARRDRHRVGRRAVASSSASVTFRGWRWAFGLTFVLYGLLPARSRRCLQSSA
jgi:hypothetical protein